MFFFPGSWGNESESRTNKLSENCFAVHAICLSHAPIHSPMNPETRAPRGTDRSPEYNEHFCYTLDSRVKNLTTEWNHKQQHFITHASRSLL